MKPFNFILGLLACLVVLMSASNAVNIESSSKAQVLAGTSKNVKQDDNDNQWIYDLIEGFLSTLAIPEFIMDIIHDVICDIDDGFDFCDD